MLHCEQRDARRSRALGARVFDISRATVDERWIKDGVFCQTLPAGECLRDLFTCTALLLSATNWLAVHSSALQSLSWPPASALERSEGEETGWSERSLPPQRVFKWRFVQISRGGGDSQGENIGAANRSGSVRVRAFVILTPTRGKQRSRRLTLLDAFVAVATMSSRLETGQDAWMERSAFRLTLPDN